VPAWGAINYELSKLMLKQQKSGIAPDPLSPSPFDVIRRKYLKEMADFTGRPVIVYASGWLEGRPIGDPSHVSVNTRDLMGFMEAVHGLPKGPLDLMLHSPGGDANAAEAIMDYLRAEGFGPIRAIVPICAMSAATMMALCCDEVVMGRHSQIGPIDPQFTLATPDGPRSAPAQAILDQFELAKTECAANQSNLAAWMPILRSYMPGLISQCLSAQKAAEGMVSSAMTKYMFSGDPDASAKAISAAEWFNDHKTHLSHGKPLQYDDVVAKGVKVSRLEDDQEFQDKVLSAWHGVQISLSKVAVNKLIENNIADGQAGTWLLSSSPGIMLFNAPTPPGPTPQAIGTRTPPKQGPNRAARRSGNR
jgi:hypothetical protein